MSEVALLCALALQQSSCIDEAPYQAAFSNVRALYGSGALPPRDCRGVAAGFWRHCAPCVHLVALGHHQATTGSGLSSSSVAFPRNLPTDNTGVGDLSRPKTFSITMQERTTLARVDSWPQTVRTVRVKRASLESGSMWWLDSGTISASPDIVITSSFPEAGTRPAGAWAWQDKELTQSEPSTIAEISAFHDPRLARRRRCMKPYITPASRWTSTRLQSSQLVPHNSTRLPGCKNCVLLQRPLNLVRPHRRHPFPTAAEFRS